MPKSRPTATLREGEHYRLVDGEPQFELTWEGLKFTVDTVQSGAIVEARVDDAVIFRALPPGFAG